MADDDVWIPYGSRRNNLVELAEHLVSRGITKITPLMLEKWRIHDDLQHVKIGKLRYTKPSWVDEWLKAKATTDAKAPGVQGVRGPRLEGNPYAVKLTDDDVREIRRRYAEGGCTTRELAAIYGVHCAQISRIINRKRWARVSDSQEPQRV